MKLYLFHGRATPDEELDDWGFDGPVLQGVDYVHSTYGTLTVGFKEQHHADFAHHTTGWDWSDGKVLEMRYRGDLVETKQGFFGDFEIQEDFYEFIS